MKHAFDLNHAPAFLTVRQVSDGLGLGEEAIRRMIKQHEIETTTTPGGQTRCLRDSVIALSKHGRRQHFTKDDKQATIHRAMVEAGIA